MNPENQQIAIATACGWKMDGLSDYSCHAPNGQLVAKSLIPNYLTDLNAIAEAERILSLIYRERYISNLTRLQYLGRLATASQRSEAFLKTLGLWKEGNEL